MVGYEGHSCNQKRNKIWYKPSVGIGFYFFFFSLPLTLLDVTDIMIRVFNFSYSLESPGKIKKTQMPHPHSVNPIKSETLNVRSSEYQGFLNLLDDSNVQPSLRMTNLDFKFEAIRKWKPFIIWSKLKCERILRNMWRVMREAMRLCCFENCSSSGPGLMT